MSVDLAEAAAFIGRRKRKRVFKLPRRTPRAIYLNPRHRFGLVDLSALHALRFNELRVYIVLASHADSDRGSCFPSRETIARETGIGDLKTVQRALKRLESKGWIYRERRTGTTNIYYLREPRMNEAVLRDWGVNNPRG